MKSFTVLACLLGLAGLADARMVQAHKGLLAKRQGSISVADDTASATPPPTADASPSASPTDGGLLGTLLGGRSSSSTADTTLGQASPNPLLPPVLPLPSASTASTVSSASSARSTSTETASARVGTVVVTSTQSTPSSASAAAQSSESKEEGSSGVGKKTLIIVIAVASSIGLVAAIWTILRKWKFSPSRKFEERLNPIDWTPEQRAAEDEKLGLGRSPSLDSSVRRQNSWGSARGAAMSEVSGYSRPAPSATGPNGYPGYPPSIPPSYTTHADHFPQQQYPSQQSLASNPYEYASVTRQGTQINGGRYGESYR